MKLNVKFHLLIGIFVYLYYVEVSLYNLVNNFNFDLQIRIMGLTQMQFLLILLYLHY